MNKRKYKVVREFEAHMALGSTAYERIKRALSFDPGRRPGKREVVRRQRKIRYRQSHTISYLSSYHERPEDFPESDLHTFWGKARARKFLLWCIMTSERNDLRKQAKATLDTLFPSHARKVEDWDWHVRRRRGNGVDMDRARFYGSGDAERLISLSMDYHRHVAKLFTSKRARIVAGREGQREKGPYGCRLAILSVSYPKREDARLSLTNYLGKVVFQGTEHELKLEIAKAKFSSAC